MSDSPGIFTNLSDSVDETVKLHNKIEELEEEVRKIAKKIEKKELKIASATSQEAEDRLTEEIVRLQDKETLLLRRINILTTKATESPFSFPPKPVLESETAVAAPVASNDVPTSGISVGLARRAHKLFEVDFERSISDLIYYRWLFRKTANYMEVLGNILLFIASAAASIAGGVKVVGSDDLSNLFLFSSTVCFAFHISLIGIAKFCAREELERERQLIDLAGEVGFRIVALKTEVTADGGNK